MKILLTLLLVSICSVAFGQSGSLSTLPIYNWEPQYQEIGFNATDNISVCIAIKFEKPKLVGDTTEFDVKRWVRGLLTEDRLYTIEKTFNCRCDKCVDVRLFNKDYTFKQFRKLIYER